MSNKNYDVVVAQEYEIIVNGKPEKKTKWNPVGKAWPSKNGNSLLFELYLIPGNRYLVSLKAKEKTESVPETEESTQFEDAPF